jgi:prepilin-type N-terminal cleavage/methylation domain-containing protein
MNLRSSLSFSRQDGFSLLEMLLSMLILTLIMGVVFEQLSAAQYRTANEQAKLDDFQQVRDFVDQFFRDINQIGDPNSRIFDLSGGTWSPPLASPVVNDSRFAIGLVKIDNNGIQFEASVNGISTVQSIQYVVNGSGNCSLCLQRSQADKVTGSPFTGQSTNWGTEVNDLVSNPIFKYYDTTGTQITSLPVDISTAAGANTIATVKTIQINLRVNDPTVIDLQTGKAIEGVFEGEVSLNNCSMASSGQAMSCN